MNHPYPEEANRRLVGTLARWHFAPTRLAREHLLGEHVARAQIYVTGNTVVDALRFAIAKQKKKLTLLQKKYGLAGRPYIILTCHRRENHGPPLRQICAAIREVAGRHPECDYLIPLHPNPAVGVKMRAALCDLPCVKLLQPLDYPEFVLLMARCLFIVTDSGGIQEEAPAIGKPVLILRERTERPEVVQAGVARLIGTRREVVAQHMLRLIEQPAARKRMSHARSLFGDGRAGKRIARVLLSTGRDRGIV
jgi:UDP-N-acetylglucosamine 2-epimerase (non-hydrolysing)